jgi:hypothetical protein
LAHTEAAFVALLRLGGVILREMALDGDLRELAILQVGRLTARLYLMLAGPDLWQVDPADLVRLRRVGRLRWSSGASVGPEE